MIGDGRHARELSDAEFKSTVRALDRPAPRAAEGAPLDARTLTEAQYREAQRFIQRVGRAPCIGEIR